MKTFYGLYKSAFFIVLICFLTIKLASAQDWFDIDWQYRNAITVSNPVGTTLSDFQVKIELNSLFDFTKAENNGSDILFTSDDGTTPIPHWIENWDFGLEATMWAKVSEIPVAGATIFMYYGNSSAPGSYLVETPLSGPYSNEPANIIVPVGDPDNGDQLLAEQIVYDDVSGHYWMPFSAIRSGMYVAMAWSDDPSNPNSWTWDGYKMSNAFSPHLIKHGSTWYLFYGDRSSGSPYPISVATSPNVNGPFTFLQTVLTHGGGWEGSRLDQPHVFLRSDGKWVIMYMGDLGLGSGNPTEHSGYATADNIIGPYTKYAGNPVLDFGPTGSYDLGGAGNPWVYEFEGIYYIGYTVTHDASSPQPWRTAWVTTTDWVNFEKQGYLLTGANEYACFRGAVTRINDTYVFPYTTKISGSAPYQMAIATQPVYMNIINNPEAVFDFYDGFDGSGLDVRKWSIRNGNISQTSVSGGELTLTAGGDWINIIARKWCSMDYIQESRARHPNQGSGNNAGEVGFSDYAWNVCRVMDSGSSTYWLRHNQLAGSPQSATDMAQTADPNWHIFSVYRQNPNIAGFRIDDNPIETTSTNVPTVILPPFLMSYDNGSQFIVDWTRVRKWAGTEPATQVIYDFTDLIAFESHTPILCQGGFSDVTILAIGGVPPYSGTGTFTQFAGTETYVVSDAMGDTASVVVSITEPPELLAFYNNTDILCHGDTSIVTITATGGTEPYSGTGTFSYPAGSFIHQVTDANGCIAEVSFTITEPPALVVTATYAEITYPGGSTTVNISATGGTPPYSGTGAFIQQAGTVIYTVSDLNGCVSGVPVTLTDPSTWFDTGWQYRKPVTITNPVGENLYEYQVQFSLDDTFDFSKVNNDGSDIRITQNDGTTKIPFWIEYWDPPDSASIWVKVLEIPLDGTVVYLYYGNPNPPEPAMIDVPPTGPWTKDPGNPLVPIGDPGNGDYLLAENTVYDAETGHYWLVFANYRPSTKEICLAWSDDPTNINAWNWYSGNPIIIAGNSPHIMKHEDTWYIFYADNSGFASFPYIRWGISVSRSTTGITGPYDGTLHPNGYTGRDSILPPGPEESWDWYRADEPYVFQRDDDKWILAYMGDETGYWPGMGGVTEQNGYAIADDIMGPYTKYSGNPVTAFGPPGSFDAGCIADPWVYLFEDTYYLGYVGAPNKPGVPANTAYQTTTDWETFTKHPIILPVGPSGSWDSDRAFRGAVSRFGDTYLLIYTGRDASSVHRMGIATQPAIMPESINDPNAVFEFYDAFDGNELDISKWGTDFQNNGGTIEVDNNKLVLTGISSGSTSGYVQVRGATPIGIKTVMEATASHPTKVTPYTPDMAGEVGYKNQDFSWDNHIRLMDSPDINFYTMGCRDAGNGSGDLPTVIDLASYPPIDPRVYKVYRLADGTAQFQIDDSPLSSMGEEYVPTIDQYPWLMSWSNTNSPQSRFEVDWVRIRKWAGADPPTSVGNEEVSVILDVRAYLEGPYNGTDMNTSLNDLGILPLSQPYNTAPWNYNGTETLTDMPNPDVVGWLLVELRDAPDAASANESTQIAIRSALLLKDGRIMELDGASPLYFSKSIQYQLFVVLWHRNHLGILSANPLLEGLDDLYTYDFSTDGSQAHGNGQNDLGNGIFGMIGGDANADGVINLSDAIQSWMPQAGYAGYLNADIDLNGQVNNPDKNDWWFQNIGSETQVPE